MLLDLIYKVCDLYIEHMVSIMKYINYKLFLNERLFTTINELDTLLYSLNFSTSIVSGFIYITKVEISN